MGCMKEADVLGFCALMEKQTTDVRSVYVKKSAPRGVYAEESAWERTITSSQSGMTSRTRTGKDIGSPGYIGLSGRTVCPVTVPVEDIDEERREDVRTQRMQYAVKDKEVLAP